MKICYSIIILFIIILSSELSAQYYENNLIKSVPLFTAKCEVNKFIRIKDAEILASNKVREVRLKNEENKPIGKLVVNAFGYIEDYYIYNEVTEIIETHWRFGYDVGNNLTSANLRAGRLRINYILTYENNQLASIHCDSAGIESQYDFAYVDGKIFKITLLDLTNNIEKEKYYFDYDADAGLISVKEGSSAEKMIEITYGKNKITFAARNSPVEIITFNDERILNETFKYNFDSNPKSAVYRAYYTTYKYSFLENGLIEKLELTDTSKKIIFTQNYEYVFFN